MAFDPYILAQITDLHVVEPGALLGGRVDTNACLARAVDRLSGLSPAPDALVVTGDLVESGRPDQYGALSALFEPLSMPIYVLPGNHDGRGALRAAVDPARLPADPGDFLHYAVDLGPIRLVAVDTLEEGRAGGRLDDGRLGWLDETLGRAPDRPTVVAMHHPPFDTGIGFMDRIGLAGREGFAAVVARHPQVERIVCGHVHRSVQARFAGTVASICPSTAHQILLTFDPDQPDAWVPEEPALQLHVWTGGGLVTHTLPVADPGPPRGMDD
jgi:3',5'-cyclic AMP phosphodiesterase CpdA